MHSRQKLFTGHLARLLLAGSVSLPRAAWAACPTDADGDGYGGSPAQGCPGVLDCNDQNQGVSPNAEELPGDHVDQDCDHNDAVAHRLDIQGFAQPNWQWAGAVSWDGDKVTVGGQAAGSVARAFNRFVPLGKLRATVGVRALSGQSGCFLDVQTTRPAPASPVTATFQLPAVGNVVSPLLAVYSAPRTVGSVTLRCNAGSSATVDWISLANAASAAGPLNEATATWKDIESPGGGLVSSVVRVPTSLSGGIGVLDGAWMASDLGGVAKLDTTTMTWSTTNGSGTTGLTTQGALAVWDVLPSGYNGILYALTGRWESDTSYTGGFWRSTDDGLTWEELGDSNDDDSAGTSDDIGGRGRYGFCNDKPYSGGRLLADEDNIGTVYIANGDPDQLGVWMLDSSADLCELPDSSSALPTDGHVRALARVRAGLDDLDALVVGYAARTSSDPSLYVCTLPEIDTDYDGLGDMVSLQCGAPYTADCAPVGGSEGLDIRDIEVDPLDPELFYTAASDLDDTCAWVDQGSITRWLAAKTAPGIVDALPLGDFTMPSGFDASDEQSVSGIAWDPDGDYFYAFFPLSHDSAYSKPRAFRIADAEIPASSAADWEAFEDGDTAAREEQMLTQDAWIGWDDDTGHPATWPDAAQVKKDPEPWRWTPANTIDASFLAANIWYGPAIGWENNVGIFATDSNAWAVFGATLFPEGTWDPDASPLWMFIPEPDLDNDLTFQTSVTNDVAMDGSGRIWAATSDLGLFMQESDNSYASMDCLWDNYNAGGKAISIGTDDSVWVGLYDQSGGDPYHEVGIFRTEDGGANWDYQGAGFPYGLAQRDEVVAGGVTYYYPYCRDMDTTHEAAPMGGTGLAFSGGSTSTSASTWGNLIDLEAVDATVAFALFSTGSSGRLAYTEDGGANWTHVTFSGSWTSGSSSGTCDEDTFFAKAKDLAIVLPGTTTHTVDTNGDGTPDALDGAVYVASRYNSSYSWSSTANACGLAKVTFTHDTPSWSWTKLQRSSTQGNCEVDEGNILGVSSPPWTPSTASGTVAYVWGAYSYVKTPATHIGGACTIDSTGTATQLVNPSSYRMTLRDVSPSADNADWLFAAGLLDVSSTLELWKFTTGLGSDPAWPLLIDVSTAPATITELSTAPPNLVGLSAGWGADPSTGDPLLLYGTEGSGAWRGDLTW